MIFYSFTNMYTAGIHAGIQTAHAVHSMQRKYAAADGMRGWIAAAETMYNYWADQCQTIIVLNAGYHSALESLYEELQKPAEELELPVVKWKESSEALNGATTAVGIIVPHSVYGLVVKQWPTPSTPQHKLHSIISRYPLAS